MTSIDASDLRSADYLPARRGLAFSVGGLLNVCVAVLIASSSVIFIEPAPYEFIFLLTFLIFLFSGAHVPVIIVPLLILAVLYAGGGLMSLMPFFRDEDAVQFTVVSAYLLVTAVFFAAFVSQNTERRLRLVLNWWVVAAVIGAVTGILGYLDIAGAGKLFSLYDRASGTTKDPNVLGALLVLPTGYVMYRFVKGGVDAPLWCCLLVVLAGAIFVTFSRGAWANMAGSSVLIMGLLFLTTPSNALKWRIIILGALACLVLAIALSAALSVPDVREAFLDRFTLTKSYDVGETGRFGNQLRSIPMLLDRPNGFGPLQFRTFFSEEPHNTFINAFASYGWLGGISFLALILSTWIIGWRLVLIATPWQPLSIVVWSVTFMTTLQCFQIDVDHWRHFFLLIGLTWGLFAASQRYRLTPPRSR
ncbi:MAG: O-antigen ligase family protein [Pseudomonadota bacterium]